AGLADSYSLHGRSHAAYMPSQEAAPKARAAALKALELDADLGEAHVAFGYTKYVFDWDWAGAEKEYQRAIELSPGYAFAYLKYSEYLTSMGRDSEALAMSKRGQQLDPVNLNICSMVGADLANLGRYDEAIEQLTKAIELDPSRYSARLDLAWTYVQM